MHRQYSLMRLPRMAMHHQYLLMRSQRGSIFKDLLRLPNSQARCVRDAAAAKQFVSEAGFSQCPSWEDILQGVRPPQPDDNEPGEWSHGL
eukprot:1017479-Karenia_brevis.AAC.1